MQEYQPKEFTLPTITGISEKSIEVHLGLYKGYVTNLNTQYQKIREVCEQGGENTAIVSALTRRIPFELAGIINHEHYFNALEGGPATPNESGKFHALLQKQFGSLDGFKKAMQHTTAVMRGIGWAMAAYDKTRGMIHIYWIVDHELGNVNLPTVLAIDMWEHAYLLDHLPADKGEYVSAYLNAINWQQVEKQFEKIQ